jgi:EpsI family protein
MLKPGPPAPTTSHFRFAAAVVLLASTSLLLHVCGRRELHPARLPLASFPDHLGQWTGTDVPLTEETLESLGPGDYLLRDYQDSSNTEPVVDLFLAYFPSQRAGNTIHSPQHSLPGSGWWPVESGRISIALAGIPPSRQIVTSSPKVTSAG